MTLVQFTYSGDTSQNIARRAQWIENAKKEGQLTWWGIFTPTDAKKIIGEFNKLYPFIKVTYWRGTNAEIGTKLEAEFAVGPATCDISLGGDKENYPRWREKGLIAKFTDIIPGIKNRDKRIYGKNGDWAQAGNNANTPQFNTEKISVAEAPKSWEDLLDPKWRGKIGFNSGSVRDWTALALAERGWGLNKTMDFLSKLKQQKVIFTGSHSATHTMLLAGEFNITAIGLWFQLNQSMGKGAPVDWPRVKPVVIPGPAMVFPAKAPHPNAARLFLEWLLSSQGLLVYDQATGQGIAYPGSGTRQSKAVGALPLVYETEELVTEAIRLNAYNKLADAIGMPK